MIPADLSGIQLGVLVQITAWVYYVYLDGSYLVYNRRLDYYESIVVVEPELQNLTTTFSYLVVCYTLRQNNYTNM